MYLNQSFFSLARIGMLNILSTKGVEGIDLDQVLVEVYAQKSEHDKNHAQDIFEEINKAQPVKLVDMPGVATKKDKKSINGGVERLQERFPKMFSSSQNCRTPNVNIDNLRDSIFAADVIKTHGSNKKILSIIGNRKFKHIKNGLLNTLNWFKRYYNY